MKFALQPDLGRALRLINSRLVSNPELIHPMKHTALILAMAAGAAVAGAQTSSTPAPSTPKPATAAPKTASATTTGATSAMHLPKGIPVVHGIVKSLIVLRYEDYKVGTGALAEPNKLYKVKYTGYRAADGVKFDSWDEHARPAMKDGKPETGADGKPVMGDPEPMQFPQGMGRLIPGFDQGFAGMHVGGKRRLFIPWQLAYGTRDIPDHGPDHPGIPPKSDLIFDVELVDVSDMPAMPQRPGMMPGRPMPPGARPGAPGAAPGAAPGSSPAPSPASGAPPAPGASAAPAAPATNPAPASQAAPPAAAPAQPSAPAQPATPPPSSAPATAPAPSTPSQPATPPQTK
jgi:peptidylprolyl isomerase